jgi:hypothetical protein
MALPSSIVNPTFAGEISPGCSMLNHRNLVPNGFTSNHLSYQLYCPFHPSSLRHPTTLHALEGKRVCVTVKISAFKGVPEVAPPSQIKAQ